MKTLVASAEPPRPDRHVTWPLTAATMTAGEYVQPAHATAGYGPVPKRRNVVIRWLTTMVAGMVG